MLTITETEIASDLADVRAEFRQHAAADGNGAWIVSGHAGRLFTRDQALAIVQLAEHEANELLDGLERELQERPE